MESSVIEKLYKNYGILADAGDEIQQHEELYREILIAVKGSDKEKRLACQFIPRFFKHFPDLANQAIEAQIDLCEDQELCIRKQAIKELPTFCRERPQFTKKVTDIMAQLLQVTETSELSIVLKSLNTLLSIDTKSVIEGIFNQIKNGDDGVREKCINYMLVKIKTLDKSVIAKIEDTISEEIRSSFQDASPEEISLFTDMLLAIKNGKSGGKQEVINILAEQIEEEKSFDAADEDSVERLNSFIKSARPLLTFGFDSSRFVVYLSKEVLPNIKKVKGYEDDNGSALEVLRHLAEISPHCSQLPSAVDILNNIYNALCDIMPLPSDENDDWIKDTQFHFSYVECLLYTYHKLLKFSPDLLSPDGTCLKEFRMRLQYFARALHGYIKILSNALKDLSPSDLAKPENRIKNMALRTTQNINVLIKDFFHTPPTYKVYVNLSWKSPEHKAALVNTKRTKPSKNGTASVELGEKERKLKKFDNSRPLYQPPNGKYSSTLKKTA